MKAKLKKQNSMSYTALEKTVKRLIKTNKSLTEKVQQQGEQISRQAFASIKHRIDTLIQRGALHESDGIILTIDLPFALCDYAEGRKMYRHLNLEQVNALNDVYAVYLSEGEDKRRIMFPHDWVWLYEQLDRMGFWNDRYNDFKNKTD